MNVLRVNSESKNIEIQKCIVFKCSFWYYFGLTRFRRILLVNGQSELVICNRFINKTFEANIIFDRSKTISPIVLTDIEI